VLSGLQGKHGLLRRGLLLYWLHLEVQGLLDVSDKVRGISASKRFFSQGQQNVANLCEPLVEVLVLFFEVKVILLDLRLQFSIVFVFLFDL
jgi:hypothetical protein